MEFTTTLIEAIKHWVNGKLKNKVSVVEGKSLSTNDYTNEEKEKLQNIADTYITQDHIPTKVSQLENDSNFATQTEIENLQNEIDILNGTGEGSVKDTVTDAVAAIVANAPEDFDTLKEVATWIENDTLGTADLLNRVSATEKNLEALDVQPDWDQSDVTAKDFIKNKPDENDALAVLTETGIIEPAMAGDNSVFIEEDGIIYTL